MTASSIVIDSRLETIPENAPAGTVVAELSLSESVQGGVSYEILSGLVDQANNVVFYDYFELKGNLIVTREPFDFEVMTSLGLRTAIYVTADLDDEKLAAVIDFNISDVLENIKGTSKFDTLVGGPGSDKFLAGGGNDVVSGNDGNDFLYGGMGQDILSGGAGADVFIFKSIKESTVKAPDLITDWQHVAGDAVRDLIDLRHIDANTKVGGNQSFEWIGTKSFNGHAGELRYEKFKSDTYVYADVNGDGKADFAVHLDDAVKMYKADFLL